MKWICLSAYFDLVLLLTTINFLLLLLLFLVTDLVNTVHPVRQMCKCGAICDVIYHGNTLDPAVLPPGYRMKSFLTRSVPGRD